jgi:hypothetical protein
MYLCIYNDGLITPTHNCYVNMIFDSDSLPHFRLIRRGGGGVFMWGREGEERRKGGKKLELELGVEFRVDGKGRWGGVFVMASS